MSGCRHKHPDCQDQRPNHFHSLAQVDAAAKRRREAEERWHTADSGAVPVIVAEPWPPQLDPFPNGGSMR